MSKLNIYRASAGSGKTYTLTKEFIFLLFRNPFDYKHILAVTFTNKATAEMKNRILNMLYLIWTGQNQDYFKELYKLEKSEEEIKSKAGLILHLLLHDFSRFSISTIDSFFQKILRAFIYELGLHNNFRTELNSHKFMQLAVDRLIMKLGQKNQVALKSWLIQSAKENMELGYNWNLSTALYTLGKQIYSENFQTFQLNLTEQLTDKKNLESYKGDLIKIIQSFESIVKEYGNKGLKLINDHGLEWDHFPGKSRTPLKIFQKMAQLEKYDDLKSVEPWVNNIDEWIRKDVDKNTDLKIRDLYNNGLNHLLSESIQFINDHLIQYNTTNVIYKQFNALGIVTDISMEIDELCREEMVYLLSNSGQLIHKIIDNNDSPFIYEKSGNSYYHFMIDEFQDTSVLQWENFKPLIENSLSANQHSLLVGDVKQSIYRWRNSDWELLARKAKNDLQYFGINEQSLDTNWRSRENIINFNNVLFQTAANILQQQLNDTLSEFGDENTKSEWNSIVNDAYKDVYQHTSKNKIGSGGEISIDIITQNENSEYEELVIKKAVDKIEKCLTNGVQHKDICVLVRKKEEAKLITNALLSGTYSEHPHAVVSNEALTLSGSIAVNMIINQLKYIMDPLSSLNSAYIHLYHKILDHSIIPSETDSVQLLSPDNELLDNLIQLKGLPLINMIEKVIQYLPEECHKNEGVFIQSLIDLANNYIKQDSADLSGFLEWWDSEGYQETISIPEEQDAIRVMTIHKSKGLEFEIVIMPFLNWQLDDTGHKEIIWCEDPFNNIELVPVQYSKNLINTLFKNDYFNEHIHRYVDNINLLYVAFTRGKSTIYGIIPELNKNNKLQKVSDLLHLTFGSNDFKLNLDKNSNNSSVKFDESGLYFGTNVDFSVLKTVSNKQIQEIEFSHEQLPNLKTWDYTTRVSIAKESDEFLSSDVSNQINKGKVMHQLFELIKVPEDLNKGLSKLNLEGVITAEQADSLEKEIQPLFNNTKVKSWFKKDVKVLNETMILSKKGIYIPDRVIIDKDSATVIDYKFGEQKTGKHISQVKNYMNFISQMTKLKTTGFIWYVFDNEIVEVKNNGQMQLF